MRDWPLLRVKLNRVSMKFAHEYALRLQCKLRDVRSFAVLSASATGMLPVRRAAGPRYSATAPLPVRPSSSNAVSWPD